MRLYNISYFFREGIHSIFTHRLMSIASVSVITACLLLMGSFTLVALNVENLMKDIEDKNEVVAYVDESLSDEQARAVGEKIREIPEVQEAVYTTKEEALENFRAEFGDEAGILDGLDDRNPLRNRYTVKLNDIHDTAALEARLREVEGIAKVSARSDISDKIIQVSDVTTVICGALILILVLVSVFIISNTVNITMFNRREEIAIMKMIGATNSFVRIPFIIEGILLGIFGAGIALLLQWGVYEYVVAGALSSISFIPTIAFGDIAGNLSLIFFGVGILVGGLGSVITLRKFLKV